MLGHRDIARCVNAAIAILFPLLAQQSKGLPFFFFAGFTLVQLVVVAAVFPETKRRTLEDLGRGPDLA